MSAINLIQKMRKGDIFMHTLRVPEGGTVKELLETISADPAIEHTLSFDGDWFQQITQDYKTPEGLFLPETYFFPKSETDVAILKRAYQDLIKYATASFDARDPLVRYKNIYETLIVASILEKEASIPEERTKIARVIINRLERGMPLQMDPTVIYGLGPSFTGSLTKKDLQKKGPYNTYLYPGLPPTPICLPSKNAIWSALHPAEGDYLYFVSQGDGSHYFSSTLKVHNQAVQKYLRRQKEVNAK